MEYRVNACVISRTLSRIHAHRLTINGHQPQLSATALLRVSSLRKYPSLRQQQPSKSARSLCARVRVRLPRWLCAGFMDALNKTPALDETTRRAGEAVVEIIKINTPTDIGTSRARYSLIRFCVFSRSEYISIKCPRCQYYNKLQEVSVFVIRKCVRRRAGALVRALPQFLLCEAFRRREAVKLDL